MFRLAGTIKKQATLVLVASCLASGGTAFAGSPPKQLYGKSIALFWAESSVNRRLSDNVTVSPTGKFERIIYISSLGRVFIRGSYAAGSSSRTGDRAQGNVSFESSSLTWYMENGAVARRFV